MKALKEEPRSCTESFLTAATTFSRKSGSRRTSGVPNRLSDVRECVFRPSHTPSASRNATQRASIRKVVNFSFLYRKLHLDLFPHLQIKVPPAAAAAAPTAALKAQELKYSNKNNTTCKVIHLFTIFISNTAKQTQAKERNPTGA